MQIVYFVYLLTYFLAVKNLMTHWAYLTCVLCTSTSSLGERCQKQANVYIRI